MQVPLTLSMCTIESNRFNGYITVQIILLYMSLITIMIQVQKLTEKNKNKNERSFE